ncbi:YciI family protein [Jiangella asiatica]|nr:YciI family protein [Jiangella asiatica]
MIMMFGDAETMLASQTKEWIEEMIAFMIQLDKDLQESGELVFQQGLADASTAKLVTLEDGVPVVTDGPFAEAKESLVGFWVVDVEDEARALEIAGRIATYAGRVEVRHAMDEPPDM